MNHLNLSLNVFIENHLKLYVLIASARCKSIRNGPVDLVGGWGGGVKEFVKIKFAEPQKGVKEICTRNIVEKKFAKQNISLHH